jgi:hypothetical protein
MDIEETNERAFLEFADHCEILEGNIKRQDFLRTGYSDLLLPGCPASKFLNTAA